jgi:hypothetical protein
VNRGKTPAIIMRVRAYCVILDQAPRALLDAFGSNEVLAEGLIIAPNRVHTEGTMGTIRLSEWRDIMAHNKTLYCCGLIDYKDVLGASRTTSFCWQYSPSRRTFLFSGKSSLNRWT